MNPLTAFAQRRRLPDFRHWLWRGLQTGGFAFIYEEPHTRCEFEWRGRERLRCTKALGHRGRHRLREVGE